MRESDGRRSARDGEAADDPGGARHDRARLPAVERDRVQVRAPAVADAEEHGAAVAGELRRAARVRGRAGHHVAVERGGQVDRLAAVERQPQQARVADRAVEAPGDDERRPVRRPRDRAADAVLEPDRLRSGAVRRVDDVDRRAEGEVGVRRRRGGEREPRPVRRPRRVAGVPVAVASAGGSPSSRGRRRGGACAARAGSPRRRPGSRAGRRRSAPGRDARGPSRPRPARRRGRRAPRTRSRRRRGSRPARRRRAAASSAAPPRRPSAGSSHTCGGPSWARRNASRDPSGDHAGEESAGPRVSGRGASPRAADQRARTLRSPSASTVRRT